MGAGRGMSLFSQKGDFQLFCPCGSHSGGAKWRFVAHGPAQTMSVRRIKQCKSLSCHFPGRQNRLENERAVVAGESFLFFISWDDSGPNPHSSGSDGMLTGEEAHLQQQQTHRNPKTWLRPSLHFLPSFKPLICNSYLEVQLKLFFFERTHQELLRKTS